MSESLIHSLHRFIKKRRTKQVQFLKWVKHWISHSIDLLDNTDSFRSKTNDCSYESVYSVIYSTNSFILIHSNAIWKERNAIQSLLLTRKGQHHFCIYWKYFITIFYIICHMMNHLWMCIWTVLLIWYCLYWLQRYYLFIYWTDFNAL